MYMNKTEIIDNKSQRKHSKHSSIYVMFAAFSVFSSAHCWGSSELEHTAISVIFCE